MPGSILGTSVRRLEDPDLLTGRSTFVGNLDLGPAAARAVFVRSPFAHAAIRGIGTAAAAAAPGVLAVHTADSVGVGRLHPFPEFHPLVARHPLATGRVRFVGDPVAMVVAETEGQALDAAELVEVDYEPLDAVVDPVAALDDDAPLQFEEVGSNLVGSVADTATAAAAAAGLARAHVVVRAQLENQRIAVVPMEGDTVAAVPGDDGSGHELTVYVSTQLPHMFHTAVTRTFGLDPNVVRVVTPHVGGAFGSKVGLQPEHAAVIAAARSLGRPVRWVQTRSENLAAMPHGRGQKQWVELGFDELGRIQVLRCRVVSDAGAYAGFGGALAMGTTRNMACGVYDIPVVDFQVAAALTNTTPMGAFRGAGRPEAAELLERMIDIAAAELGVDPVDLRRRNLRPAFASTVTTVTGMRYDTGDYQMVLDEALRHAGYDDLRAEQAGRRAAGSRLQLGIGVCTYVEVTAQAGTDEFASVEVHLDGTATVRAGTSAHGQGHVTAFAMIVSDTLGIPVDRISLIQSDTAAVPRGHGTGGSRSLQIAGSAVLEASELVLAQAKELAADHLEVSADDVVVHAGTGLGAAGVPSSALSWAQLAGLAAERGDADRRDLSAAGSDGAAVGEGELVLGPLGAQFDFRGETTFPFGAHVSVVEVNVETGRVRPVRHVAVDDCGRIVNPLLVAGQQHGGIAQGMSQALWEEMVFDEAGNPITGTLADYAMPSAAELISFDTVNTETPTFRNPLGAKGIGESGTVGAMPSVHNAVVDALAHLGVRHVPMPCTPERVWRAIEAAKAGGEGAAAGGRALWTEPPSVFARLPRAGAGKEDTPEAANVGI